MIKDMHVRFWPKADKTVCNLLLLFFVFFFCFAKRPFLFC